MYLRPPEDKLFKLQRGMSDPGRKKRRLGEKYIIHINYTTNTCTLSQVYNRHCENQYLHDPPLTHTHTHTHTHTQMSQEVLKL